jgi:hypothetical protein
MDLVVVAVPSLGVGGSGLEVGPPDLQNRDEMGRPILLDQSIHVFERIFSLVGWFPPS